jgi:hypothetical protein
MFQKCIATLFVIIKVSFWNYCRISWIFKSMKVTIITTTPIV